MSSYFDFTVASWFLGNVHIKPISTRSAPAACDSRVWLACCRWFWMMTTSWHVHIRRSHCFSAGPVELGGQGKGGGQSPPFPFVQFWLDDRLLQGLLACWRWFGVMTISWHFYKCWPLTTVKCALRVVYFVKFKDHFTIDTSADISV